MSRTLRVLVAALMGVLLAGLTAVTFTTPAQASTRRHHLVGRIDFHFQNRNGSIRMTGWVFDARHRRRHEVACLMVHNRCVHRVHARLPSPRFSRRHHLRGGHRFDVTLRPRRPGIRVGLRTVVGHNYLDAAHALTPGRRVVRVAKRFVGGRYVYGGASPRTGFDCSGYSMYSYRRGQVARLPHNANAQRFAPHMHRIARSRALPGDLIFYYSGGRAYHVAIFAGHGMQYSASTPRIGIVYQHIHARNITFGTDWH